MGEKQEDEFDEDADELDSESEDSDLERATKDLEMARKRGQKGGGDPAWRRLELLMEQKRTAEMLSDFDDYDIGLPDDGAARRKPRPRRP